MSSDIATPNNPPVTTVPSQSTTKYEGTHPSYIGTKPNKEPTPGLGEKYFSSVEYRDHLDKLTWQDKLDKFHPDLKFTGEGFEGKLGKERQKLIVTSLLATNMLPVGGIREIAYEPISKVNADRLGTWSTDGTRKMTFHKSIEKYSVDAASVATHELAHECSPFNPETPWKSEAIREAVKEQVRLVANQTLDTNIHLNGYHKFLCKQFKAGKINEERLCEETQAILCELRLHDPKKVLDIQEQQRKQVKRKQAISLWDASTALYSGRQNEVAYMDEADVERHLEHARHVIENQTRAYEIAQRKDREEGQVSQLRQQAAAQSVGESIQTESGVETWEQAEDEVEEWDPVEQRMVRVKKRVLVRMKGGKPVARFPIQSVGSTITTGNSPASPISAPEKSPAISAN